MDAAALRDAVEARAGDALADLERPAVLVALCDGPPHREALLRATLASERAAATTFAGWARTAGDDRAADVFRRTADRERDHARRVAAALHGAGAGRDDGAAGGGGSPVDPDAPGPLHAFLRGLEPGPARVGAGLVGRPLASLRTYARLRAWAAERDDAGLGTLVAGLADETGPSLDDAAGLLGAAGARDEAVDAAVEAAAYAVRLVRDDHADALAALGRSFE